MGEHLTFGQRIKELRVAAGFIQKDVANRVGMEVTYLSKVETNRLPPPSEQKIRAIAEAVGGDADELLLLAQKLPGDIPAVIHESVKIPQFLRTARGLCDDEWDELIKLAEQMRRVRS